ncbi:MAG TPA: hypothetical protein VNQ76_01300 [Planctomicrobium sp.]|nr:hypothetical protein [Planctomicrobium sp.]
MTGLGKSGVPCGVYQITVASKFNDVSPEELMNTPRPVQTVNPIPPKYRTVKDTDLSVEVKKGRNDLNLHLSSKK